MANALLRRRSGDSEGAERDQALSADGAEEARNEAATAVREGLAAALAYKTPGETRGRRAEQRGR